MGAPRLTKLNQCSVCGVLQIGAGETAQDIRRSGGTEPKRGRELHHLVVLATDQVPIDRSRQHRPQSWIRIGFAGDRARRAGWVHPKIVKAAFWMCVTPDLR
jgi:hypothetical protein